MFQVPHTQLLGVSQGNLSRPFFQGPSVRAFSVQTSWRPRGLNGPPGGSQWRFFLFGGFPLRIMGAVGEGGGGGREPK